MTQVDLSHPKNIINNSSTTTTNTINVTATINAPPKQLMHEQHFIAKIKELEDAKLKEKKLIQMHNEQFKT